jgi:CheY-like chemotaxis protein
MKILWIDDLKGDTTPREIAASVSSYFEGFLDQSPQEDLNRIRTSEEDEIQGILRPLLKRNSHPIHWYDGFVNGLNAIVKESFDFIILDANLPIDKESLEEQRKKASFETDRLLTEFRDKGVLPSEDMEAGFILYFYLVQEQGFPRDRVVFLSANASDAQKTLDKFGETKAIPPKIFSKNDSKQVEEFRETLGKFSKDEHLNLRRGILEVLTPIESLPTQPPFEENGDDPVNGVAFVNGLRFLLKDHRIPSSEEDIQRFYLVLCDYLTKPFERFSIESLHRGLYRWKVKVSKEYVMPAYFMRNWIAHGVMSNSQSKLSAKDVGFVFIIVIKSLFHYSCLETFKTLYGSPDKSIDLIGLLSDLHKKHYSSPPDSSPIECDIFELIRLKGEKKKRDSDWQNEPFVAHLYASFLFHTLELCSSSDELYWEKRTAYYFKLRYRISSTKDDLFEGLKPIAYHRLQELKPLLPS